MRITGLFDSHIGEEIHHKIAMMAGKFPEKWGYNHTPPSVDPNQKAGPTNVPHLATSVVEFEANEDNSVQIAKALFSAGAKVLVNGQQVQLMPEEPVEVPVVEQSLELVPEPDNVPVLVPEPIPSSASSFEDKLKGWFTKIALKGPIN